MTKPFPQMRCRHGWADPSQCETCKLYAEADKMKAALRYYALGQDPTLAKEVLGELAQPWYKS